MANITQILFFELFLCLKYNNFKPFHFLSVKLILCSFLMIFSLLNVISFLLKSKVRVGRFHERICQRGIRMKERRFAYFQTFRFVDFWSLFRLFYFYFLTVTYCSYLICFSHKTKTKATLIVCPSVCPWKHVETWNFHFFGSGSATFLLVPGPNRERSPRMKILLKNEK